MATKEAAAEPPPAAKGKQQPSISPPGTDSGRSRTRSVFSGQRAVNRPCSPPTKAKLPSTFLSVAAIDGSGPLAESADSPETCSTSISCHGTSVQSVADMAAAALTEIFFEREIFPQVMFRELSRFGLRMHQAGSPAATADDGLAAQLGQAFEHLNHLKQLVASRPDRIVVSVFAAAAPTAAAAAAVSAPPAPPLERWIFDLEVSDLPASGPGSDPTGLQAEQARAELKAELAIVLRQVRASSVFLPALEGRVEVRMEAAAQQAASDCDEEETGLALARMRRPDDDDDGDDDDDSGEDTESEAEADTEAAVPVLRAPPQQGRRSPGKLSVKRSYQQRLAAAAILNASPPPAPFAEPVAEPVAEPHAEPVWIPSKPSRRLAAAADASSPPTTGTVLSSPAVAVAVWLLGTAAAVVAVAYAPLSWGGGAA